jgi:hypothetical protein
MKMIAFANRNDYDRLRKNENEIKTKMIDGKTNKNETGSPNENSTAWRDS